VEISQNKNISAKVAWKSAKIRIYQPKQKYISQTQASLYSETCFLAINKKFPFPCIEKRTLSKNKSKKIF